MTGIAFQYKRTGGKHAYQDEDEPEHFPYNDNPKPELRVVREAVAETAPETNDEKPRFNTVWGHDLTDDDDYKTWIVRGVFAEGEFSYIVSVPGTGKSALIGDAACHLAAGLNWHGFEVREARMVLYIAAERASLVKRRIRAWQKKNDHAGKHHVLVLDGRIDLTRGLEDAIEFTEIVRQAEEQSGLRCGLVVIDTLTRVFGAGDQNTSKDMTKLINSIDYMQSELPHVHINIIHHTTHAGERAKGAIDLDGAVDVSFSAARRGGSVVFANTGSNDGVEGDLLAYRFESVTLGKDKDGEWTTAPVVVPVDIPSGKREPGEKVESEAAMKARVRREAFELAIIKVAHQSGGNDEDGWWWISGRYEAETTYKETEVGIVHGKNWWRAPEMLIKADRLQEDEAKNVYRLQLTRSPTHSEGE